MEVKVHKSVGFISIDFISNLKNSMIYQFLNVDNDHHHRHHLGL